MLCQKDQDFLRKKLNNSKCPITGNFPKSAAPRNVYHTFFWISRKNYYFKTNFQFCAKPTKQAFTLFSPPKNHNNYKYPHTNHAASHTGEGPCLYSSLETSKPLAYKMLKNIPPPHYCFTIGKLK